MGREGSEALVEPGFAIAIDADAIAPPGPRQLASQQQARPVFRRLRHGKDALVQNHHACGSSFQTADISFNDGDLIVRIRPEPFFISCKALAGEFQEPGGSCPVSGECQTAYARPPSDRNLFLVTRSGEEAKITCATWSK